MNKLEKRMEESKKMMAGKAMEMKKMAVRIKKVKLSAKQKNMLKVAVGATLVGTVAGYAIYAVRKNRKNKIDFNKAKIVVMKQAKAASVKMAPVAKKAGRLAAVGARRAVKHARILVRKIAK